MSGRSFTSLATSATLLDNIRSLKNQDAWERFVALYGPYLMRLLMRRGLTHDDALDVVQDTLVTVVDHIGDFHYDPEKRFRSWLATVALRKAWRHRERRQREPAVHGGTTNLQWMQQQAEPGGAHDGQTDRIETALDRLRAESPPVEWGVFRLTVLEDTDCRAAAEQLQIEIGYLYVCRSRVKRRLRRILEQDDE